MDLIFMSAAQLSEAVTVPSLFTPIHYNNDKVAKSSTVYTERCSGVLFSKATL